MDKTVSDMIAEIINIIDDCEDYEYCSLHLKRLITEKMEHAPIEQVKAEYDLFVYKDAESYRQAAQLLGVT